jgi:hypothetical protein
MPISPDEVSASGAPPADQWVTGPAFVLALVRTGSTEPLHVVNVSYDRKALADWYTVAMERGVLPSFEAVQDLQATGKTEGGIWEVPAGKSVAIGMQMVQVSTP